ncbi:MULTISPECIES: hypothetical protein [Stenotrophomonas]|uniref:hypothetical protein n=1 Tax=Stenotrophomonas TaxID=40323 RepID=UPI000A5095B2|nr:MULTISPECIES: hypothetical protein [Stenotrophomonas]
MVKRCWGVALLSGLLACTGCAADIPSDRATLTVAGPLASLQADTLTLPPGSPQLPALLADPAGWQPEPAAEGVERSSVRGDFDADGWLRTSVFSWDDSRGWEVHMAYGEGGRTPPATVRIWMQAPRGSGQPDWPMGEGTVRYAGATRILSYKGRRPGAEGREDFERSLTLGPSHWVELEESTSVAPDGAAVRKRRQVMARDAQGRPVDDAELLDGAEYRVSNQYFLPDGQGNPRRIVRLYRAAGAAQDAPVLRAEVILRTLRYQDETR